jgi:CubicO group peptidase (beta-lactamase class C family)
MRHSAHCVITIAICLCGQIAFSQENDTTSRIDKLFSSWNNSTPGGSIIVARSEKVLYHKAFGLSNLEGNIPNTTETIFEAGSVSKQFTAYSILLLESEGKLKLTDDVRKYVPELPVYEAPVTIQHCLNHTSGLKDWGSVGSLTGWPRGTRDYTTPLGLHIMGKQKSTNFKPGNEYSYSNSNYTMLTVIVERLSKQSLEDFTRDRLFKPLGMTHTRWRSDFRDVVPGRAQAYSRNEQDYELNMPFEHIYGHGGLLTTTGDLLIWNRLLDKHDALYMKRVEEGKLNNGKSITYAAGIQHGYVTGQAEIAHSGATAGYRAWLAYYPSKKMTIALLSNDANFPVVDAGKDIAKIYFGEGEERTIREPDPVPEKATYTSLDPFAGEYYSEEAECTWKIRVENNKLVATMESLEDLPLEADVVNTFVCGGNKIEFRIDSKKKITGFNISVSRASNVPFKKIR